MKEPCLCGAPDCPRCFPGTWRTANMDFCELCEEYKQEDSLNSCDECGTYACEDCLEDGLCQKYLEVVE